MVYNTGVMSDVLQKIIERRIQTVKAMPVSIQELQTLFNEREDFRPFHNALKNKITDSSVDGKTAAIIAEIKRGSPARGLFAPDLDVSQTANDYEIGGAACISVLTEEHFFFGSLDNLKIARDACSLPVLEKDFIVSEKQIYEAAVYADAILLIARCLERNQISDYHQLASELNLDALVEIFDEYDVEKIAPFSFPLIGINNRNLSEMSIDLENTNRLINSLGKNQTVVAASGIHSRSDIDRLMLTGVRTFLIGEALSVSADRIQLLKQFVGDKTL
ncbi:MAG: indole-3-glycerol phosphate synthase TrpC [Planctomycetaceae bacterium]|nr:indole-3-glycerol phosphate synthase TrpC [Planctomycetaceae bacterium]